uniref:DUF4283 domain-containing protein n=1 Tax=Cannabis sativa TaxID=3483 RepID=A0A803PSE9_CANSA
MAKKKRATQKLVVVVDRSETEEDLPSIQEANLDCTPTEEFHGTYSDLEVNEAAVDSELKENRSSPKSVSWAEEVEKNDFQSNAKEIWSNFKSNQVLSPSTRLSYTEPKKLGDRVIGELDLEEVEIEASFWKNDIVCMVLGANPPFKVFEGFVKRVWGNLGVEKVMRMHSGCTLVTFRDEATRDLVLETRVIHFDKKPVILRPWSTNLDTARLVKSVPVRQGINHATAVVEVQKDKGDQMDKARKGDEEKRKLLGGMNKKEKHHAILEVWRENKIRVAALFETKIKHKKNANLGSLSDVVKNLLMVKHALKKFNKEVVGDIVVDYNLAKHEFCKAHEALAYQPTDKRLHEEEKCCYNYLLQLQPSYFSHLKQQSKITWIQCNDENSSYFHASMRKRRIENRITTFTIGDKVEDDYPKVIDHFITHFKSFMGSRSTAISEIDHDSLVCGNKLSLEQQIRLIAAFSKSDVKRALFGIHSLKSPGMDGFRSDFFKHLWPEIGDDITRAVLGFFPNGMFTFKIE